MRLICSLQLGFIHRQKTFYPPRTASHVRYCQHFPLEWSQFQRYLARRYIFLFLLPLVTRWWTTLTSYSMYVFIYFLCCFRCPKCNSGQMLNHLCTLILNHSNPPRKRRKKRYEGPVCEEKIFPPTNLAIACEAPDAFPVVASQANLASEWFGDHASETVAW